MKIKKTLKWIGIAVAIYFVTMTIYLLGSGKLAIVPSESEATGRAIYDTSRSPGVGVTIIEMLPFEIIYKKIIAPVKRFR